MILLALLSVGCVCLAQRMFTLATFKEMLEEYKKDSKAFFINRLSDDFRYSNPEGKFLQKSDVTTSDAQKVLTTIQAIDRMLANALGNDILEPIIFQSRDLAVVSGIQKTPPIGNDGNENTSQVACTYTFQKRKGRWMFVASQQTSLAQ